MKINSPVLVQEGDHTKLEALIEYDGLTRNLWYSVAHQYAPYLTYERADAFVVGLLPLAMKRGEPIEVLAPLSEKLYFNLSQYYQQLLATTVEGLKPVPIIAHQLTAEVLPCESAVVTGFSGGVDSFCNLQDNYFSPDIPASMKLTHLIFNNVGSHGEWDANKAAALFRQRYNRLKQLVDSLGLPFIAIDSNLSDLLMMEFRHAHTPRNVSAILILQKMFKRYYYASSVSYAHCKVGPTMNTAYSDAITLPLLSTETLECTPTGAQHSRIEKTLKTASMPIAYETLDVCIRAPEKYVNCGSCPKCARTILTLQMLGKLERFLPVFDIAAYTEARSNFIWRVWRERHNAFNQELIDLANTIGYPLPGKFLAHIVPRRRHFEIRNLSRPLNELFPKIKLPQVPLNKPMASSQSI